MIKEKNIFNFLGNEKSFCEGFFAGAPANNYIIGVSLSAAKTKINFSRYSPSMLDEIIAFDKAETAKCRLGQINLIKVSSFCGPRGAIWGYDICFNGLKRLNGLSEYFSFPIYDLSSLEDSFLSLVGSVGEPKFPFLPGSHVPCAAKKAVSKGRRLIYSALGIGIPLNREKNACLLMEDAAAIRYEEAIYGLEKELILKNIIKSILKVGSQQSVEFEKIFTGLSSILVEPDEIGCAIAASPYFLLAKNAVPNNKNLFEFTLDQWSDLIK